jgi:hypothetical protein
MQRKAKAKSAIAEPPDWPSAALEQIAALKQLVGGRPVSIEEATGAFKGTKRDLVARHLETLAILGEVRQMKNGRYMAPTTYWPRRAHSVRCSVGVVVQCQRSHTLGVPSS